MNPEVKAEWVKRLRSGDYKQGRERLGMNNEFCCLGVLCDLAVEKGIVRRNTFKRTDLNQNRIHRYDGAEHYLPEAVLVWADLDSFNPRVEFKGFNPEGTTTLSSLNDRGKDFNVIADVIEAQL